MVFAAHLFDLSCIAYYKSLTYKDHLNRNSGYINTIANETSRAVTAIYLQIFRHYCFFKYCLYNAFNN